MQSLKLCLFWRLTQCKTLRKWNLVMSWLKKRYVNIGKCYLVSKKPWQSTTIGRKMWWWSRVQIKLIGDKLVHAYLKLHPVVRKEQKYTSIDILFSIANIFVVYYKNHWTASLLAEVLLFWITNKRASGSRELDCRSRWKMSCFHIQLKVVSTTWPTFVAVSTVRHSLLLMCSETATKVMFVSSRQFW